MKWNNIYILAIPEGEERKQGIENIFEEIMTENFLKLVKEKVTQVQEAQRVPNKLDPQSCLLYTSDAADDPRVV